MDFEKERGPRTVKPRLTRRPRPAASPRESAFEGDRLAKIMARAGLCSRRDAEEWIRAGRVSLNGEVLTDPAKNVTAQDEVSVDGRPIAGRDKTRLFLFNKPRGLVTTDRDPEGRPTVFAYLAHHHPDLPRLVSIGRLDITSEGLLLLTNDGGLARVLELPATGWLRRYRVRAHGTTTAEAVASLKDGVTIDGVAYQPIEASLDRVQGANTWLTVALREGKNREVRRLLEHLGLEVNRLIRLSYGPFQLGEAADGAVEEVRTRVLMDQLGPTLIAQAGADFSAGRREEVRDARQRDDPEMPPPKREKPQAGKRKHVSTLRAERDTRVRGDGERVRTERGATEDRRGRSVQVERVTAARPKQEEDDTRNGRRFRSERKDAPRKGTEWKGPRGEKDESKRGSRKPPGDRGPHQGRGPSPGRGSSPGREPSPGRGTSQGRGPSPGRKPAPGRGPTPGRGPAPNRRGPSSGGGPSPGRGPGHGGGRR